MTAQQEIDKLRAAILRSEEQIDVRFPFDRAHDVCCQDCKWNGDAAYRKASSKLARQEAWLQVLLAKQSGDVAAALVRAKELLAGAIYRSS